MKQLFCLLCILICYFNGSAQTADTIKIGLRPKHFIAPVSLATAGLITQGRMSRHFQQEVRAHYPGFSSKADEYLIYAPGVLSLSLGASGVKGKNNFRDQVILAVLSSLVSQGVTQGLKKLVGYPRPDGSGFDAFPSGHTTMAFTSATLLHEEYGHRSAWYSVGGYAVATASGGLRILNNKHWLSDVLMGAGVGIGATKGTYLVYPWAKNKIKVNKSNRRKSPDLGYN